MSDIQKNTRDIVSFWSGIVSVIFIGILPFLWTFDYLNFKMPIVSIKVRLIIGLITSLFILIPCALANEQFNQIAKLSENSSTRLNPFFVSFFGIIVGIFILLGWVPFESNSKLTGIDKNWLLEVMTHNITTSLMLPTMMSIGVFFIAIHLSSFIRHLISNEIIDIEETNFEILKWEDEYHDFLSQSKVLFDEADKARKKQLLLELTKLLLKKCKAEIYETPIRKGNFNFEEMYTKDRQETFAQLNKNYNWPKSIDMTQIKRFVEKEFRSAYISKFLLQYLRFKFDKVHARGFTTNFTVNESIELLKMFVEFPKLEDFRNQYKKDILSEFVDKTNINPNTHKMKMKLGVFLNLVHAQYKITYDRSRVGNIILTEKPLQLDLIETVFTRMSELLNLGEYRYGVTEFFEFHVRESSIIHINELGLSEIQEDYNNIIKAYEFTRLLPFQERDQQIQTNLKKIETQLSKKLQKITTSVE
jgi:hypothetical protein